MATHEAVHEALLLAITRHHGQLRKKSEVPYIVHPIRVARLATLAGERLGLKPAQLALIKTAALLHDTIEDTDTEPDELVDRFGEGVATVVQELTQDKSLPRADRRRQMIQHCSAMSFEARLIKLADRLDNMRDLSEFDRAFVTRYCEEAEAMVEAMRGTEAELEAALRAAIASNRPPS